MTFSFSFNKHRPELWADQREFHVLHRAIRSGFKILEMPAHLIALEHTSRRGLRPADLHSHDDVLRIGWIRQAQDDIRAADRILPSRAGAQDVIKSCFRVIAGALKVVYHLQLNILGRWKGHIEFRPRHFLLLVADIRVIGAPISDLFPIHLDAEIFDFGIFAAPITG